jgi:CxxC motif-containing protein (DUF1111 family)
MAKIRCAYACSLAGLAAIMLGATALSNAAMAQERHHGRNDSAQNVTGNGNHRNGERNHHNNNNNNNNNHQVQATDPGVRGGAPGAGQPLPGLTADELLMFNASKGVFTEVDDVAAGLGPGYNLDGCAGCHAQPDVGGVSPQVNPQVAVAARDGEKLPGFLSANTSASEVRLKKNPDGTPDGGVHQIFTIANRADSGGCQQQQEDLDAQFAAGNVTLRIPTPVFGMGLVQSVRRVDFEASLAANAQAKASMGVAGHFNHSGNDGTITYFGWKAQNKSAMVFAGEAYNVEQGVTNDNFPSERTQDPTCITNPVPESTSLLTPASPSRGSPTVDFMSDIDAFARFMERLDAPTPTAAAMAAIAGAASVTAANAPVAAAATAATTAATTTTAAATTMVASAGSSVMAAAAATPAASTASTASTADATVTRGFQVFNNIGCGLCHTTALTVGPSGIGGATGTVIHPFSDFAVHHMGTGLDDGVSQGEAGPDEFRSAPLWGVGQRIYLLHDGRTTDLVRAIEAHASTGSEANGVIANFNKLSTSDQQAVLNLLRAL